MSMETLTVVNWGNTKRVYKISSLRSIAGFVRKIGFNYFIERKRLKEFIEFSNLFSNEYRLKGKSSEYKIPHKDFDYVIVGSDQVWANWLTPEEMEYFTLSDVPNNKRIAYAASMGNPDLRADTKLVFDREVDKFARISVRESAAQEYIENNIERNVPVVLDPTMLLTNREWLNLFVNLNNSFDDKSKYIFTYFLSKPSKNMKIIIKKLKNQGYKFVNFNSKKIFSRKYYGLGPESFVFAVSSSSGVLTDSFHASVFAILFEKPFYIDPNRFGGTMSARIDTLLSSTGLESRRVVTSSKIEDFWNVDYSDAKERMEKLRLDSLDYLKKSLKF